MAGGLRGRSQAPKRILVLLLALTLVRGLLYAAITIPWWAGHDEEFHFAHTQMLIDRWVADNTGQRRDWRREMGVTFMAFPRWLWSAKSGPPDGSIDLDAVHTSVQFPADRYTRFQRASFPYYLYAWPGRFLRHQDLLVQLFTLRGVSVLITCGTIFFSFLSAREIFPDSLMMQVLVPWIIVFNPAFMVTSSTVSDAHLAILFSSVVFYLLLLEIKQLTWWRTALALVLTIPAMWAKATAYFLVFVWTVLVIVYVWRLGRRYWLWLGIIGGLFGFTLIFFLPTRLQGFVTAGWMSLQSGIDSEVVSPEFYFVLLEDVFASFWIVLGWFVYRLARIWYIILLVPLLLAVVGLLIYWWRKIRTKSRPILGTEQRSLLLALLFVGTSITILVAYSALTNYGGWRVGRYIFPVIVPLSVLMVAGWRELIPDAWRKVAGLGIASAFFLFDTMVVVTYFIPWYYPFWPH